MPPARNIKEEASIEIRKDTWYQDYKEHKEVGETRGEKETNLIKEEARGRKKLEETVKKGQIHVTPADLSILLLGERT